MADIGQQAVNAKAVTGGRWFTFIGDAEFLIASGRSRDYSVAIAVALSKVEDSGITDDAEKYAMRQRLMDEAFATVLVKGWRNVQVGETDLPYSMEQAVDFCTNPKWVKVYDFLKEKAGILGNYEEKAMEAAEGN